MHQHAWESKIQENGCDALANLVVKNLRNQDLVARAGAIPIIIQAMRQHVLDPKVHEASCRVLRNLALENVHNQALVAEAGAIPIIVQAKDRNPKFKKLAVAP